MSLNASFAFLFVFFQGEIHSVEPAEGRRKQATVSAAAAATTTTSDLSPAGSGSPPSRGLLHAVLSGGAPAATDAASDRDNVGRDPTNADVPDNDNIGGARANIDVPDSDNIGGYAASDKQASWGQRSTHAGGDHLAGTAADVFAPIHVAYRHSDLQSVRSRSPGIAGGVSSSSTGTEEATLTRDVNAAGRGGPNASEERRGGEAHHQQQDGGSKRRSLENEVAKEGESVGPFRMPAAVASGVGGTWDRGPFGPAPECPSSRKVFQIGVAVDTGFFKVSFAYKS